MAVPLPSLCRSMSPLQNYLRPHSWNTRLRNLELSPSELTVKGVKTNPASHQTWRQPGAPASLSSSLPSLPWLTWVPVNTHRTFQLTPSSAGSEQEEGGCCNSCSQGKWLLPGILSFMEGLAYAHYKLLTQINQCFSQFFLWVTSKTKTIIHTAPLYFHRTTAPELHHLTLHFGHPILVFSPTAPETHCRLSWTPLVGIVRYRDKVRVTGLFFLL